MNGCASRHDDAISRFDDDRALLVGRPTSIIMRSRELCAMGAAEDAGCCRRYVTIAAFFSYFVAMARSSQARRYRRD